MGKQQEARRYYMPKAPPVFFYLVLTGFKAAVEMQDLDFFFFLNF